MGVGASVRRSISGSLYQVKKEKKDEKAPAQKDGTASVQFAPSATERFGATGSQNNSSSTLQHNHSNLSRGHHGGLLLPAHEGAMETSHSLQRWTSGISNISTRLIPMTPSGVYSIIPVMKLDMEIDHPSAHWQARLLTARMIECLSVCWSPDDELIAAGYADGAMRIFDPRTGSRLYTAHLDDNEDDECVARGIKYRAKEDPLDAPPCITAIRWKPEAKKDKRELLTVDQSGKVTVYKVQSGEKPQEKFCLREDEFNHGQLAACDWVFSGDQVAVAGLKKVVFIYDIEARKPVVELKGGPSIGEESILAHHRSRILEVRCAAHDPQIVLSAAWDHAALLWDLRTGCVVRAFTTPELVMNGGRPADISSSGDMVCTASDITGGDITLWDTGGRGIVAKEPCLAARPTCVVFSRDASSSDIAAGSGGYGNVGTLRRSQVGRGESKAWKLDFTSWATTPADVWAIDWANKSKRICVGCQDGGLAILSES